MVHKVCELHRVRSTKYEKFLASWPGAPHIGIMEKKMETTIMGLGFRVYRDNDEEDGSYYSVLGLFRDSGKENGNYYSIMGYTLFPSFVSGVMQLPFDKWGTLGGTGQRGQERGCLQECGSLQDSGCNCYFLKGFQ